jgi:putative protease
MKKIKKPELLAPAGNWTMLRTAVRNGADAVYFGLEKLNMRAMAKNFTKEELPEVVKYCRENGVDTHLTMNTIVYEEELSDVEELLTAAKEAGVTMVIAWDHAVIRKAVEYGIPLCISTQASVSNSIAAQFYKDLGAKRIVLARECTIQQIKDIKAKVDVEIEAFVHGAMCIAISGRCFLSHYAFGRSANRGDCIQPCRREFEIRDLEGKLTFDVGGNYVLSAKDLMTINFIDKLIEAGIDSFKIEGRKRSPEYLATVVSVYREAIDSYFDGTLTEEKKNELIARLEHVYNRGFSAGFYFGRPGHEDFATQRGSLAKTRKRYVGKVLNYYKKPAVVHVKLEAADIKLGDKLYIMGQTTGTVEKELTSLVMDEQFVEEAPKGSEVTFRCGEIVRPNDKVFKIEFVAES